MKYILKPQFALRSWEDVPYAISNLENGETLPVNKNFFQTLAFCDGFTNFDALYIPNVYKSIIPKLIKNGLIEECPSGASLENKQKHKHFDNAYMKLAHWSITGKCNFKCKHCYLSAPEGRYGELSTEDCLYIINQLAECGIMKVNLTGGEPLIRKDFWQLVDALCEKNINIDAIYTNGALVNEKLLDELEKRHLKPMFSISFDGIGWHDWLRGIDGAEKIALDAFDLLHKRGFEIDVEMCLHKNNQSTLNDTINLLAAHGVTSVKTNPASSSGEWIKENEKYGLTRDQVFDIYLNYIPKFLKAGSPLNLHLGGFFYCKKGSTDYTLPFEKFDGTKKNLSCKACDHARYNMYICPDGQLLPCMSLAGIETGLKKTFIQNAPLRESLKSSAYLSAVSYTVGDIIEKNPECKSCKHNLVCGGGCRAIACLTSNNFLGCDRASCDLFNKGYDKKIREVVSQTLNN